MFDHSQVPHVRHAAVLTDVIHRPTRSDSTPSCITPHISNNNNTRLRSHRPSLPSILSSSLSTTFTPSLSTSTPSSLCTSPSSSRVHSPLPSPQAVIRRSSLSCRRDSSPIILSHPSSQPIFIALPVAGETSDKHPEPLQFCPVTLHQSSSSVQLTPGDSPGVMTYVLLNDTCDVLPPAVNSEVLTYPDDIDELESCEFAPEECESDDDPILDVTDDPIGVTEIKIFHAASDDESYDEDDDITVPFDERASSIDLDRSGDDRTVIDDSSHPGDQIDLLNDVLPMEEEEDNDYKPCGKRSSIREKSGPDTPDNDHDTTPDGGEVSTETPSSFEKVDFSTTYTMSTLQRRVWQVLGVVLVVILVRIGHSAWQLVQQLESVHNWTTDDVEVWLKDVVGLPQYLPIFKKNKIDGNFLPRLALNTDHLIQTQLGISDLNHKNKLILKAMDLVLFGPPTVFYNPLKDALLALAILVAVSGLFFSTVQRRKAQNQISKMLEEVDKLQINEQKFLEIQSVLHEAEIKNETVSKEKQSMEKKLKVEICHAKAEAERLAREREATKTEVERLTLAEQELAQVRSALNNAESKNSQVSSFSKELQVYLKLTYKKEREQYNVKKAAADRQLEEAKQWGLKMKKKRTGMVNSLKMIHGNSLDAVECRISSARSALIEATSDLQELSSRWRRIETLCNFNITSAEGDSADQFGSQVSLADSDSNASSPEPQVYSRSNSTPSNKMSATPTRLTQSLKIKEKVAAKNPKFHGSSPNLASHELLPAPLPRNASSNAVRDLLTKDFNHSASSSSSSATPSGSKESGKQHKRGKMNGHADSATESDDSGEKRRKGKNLWRLVRESRLNSDQKWKDLLSDKD